MTGATLLRAFFSSSRFIFMALLKAFEVCKRFLSTRTQPYYL